MTGHECNLKCEEELSQGHSPNLRGSKGDEILCHSTARSSKCILQRSVPLSAWFGPLHFSEAHSQVNLASNQGPHGEISRDLFEGIGYKSLLSDSSSDYVCIRTTLV